MTLLDPMDVDNRPFLLNMQGNILKGHGRDHTTHIFITFNEGLDRSVARKWLKEFTEKHVTCFQQQLKERELFKRNGTPGRLFASVFLTRIGYEYLGFTDVQEKLPDPGFLLGMKGRVNDEDKSKNVNNDPPINEWEKGFQQPIHAMILLADNDLRRMGETATKLIKDNLEKISHICSIEYGHVIRNVNGDGIEHFGYVDGVSQPLFLKDEVDDYMQFHNTTPGTAKFNPTADTDLVLIEDPYAPDNTSGDKHKTPYGSYFVFRKLEQNVKGFKEAEDKIGDDLYGPDAEEKHELIGAMLVGRSEDGTPVVISDTDGLVGGGKFNNFNYDNDPSGGRCPHFAHIRKTNPRKDTQDTDGTLVDHKSRIIARRGIPFGHRAIDTSLGLDPTPHQMPEGDVGLLFMSYQASIERQFEAIQQKWANDKNFPSGTNTGIDPVIGQTADQDLKRSYTFPEEYGSGQLQANPSDFEQYVHMKGGDYFFAPSLSFLNNL